MRDRAVHLTDCGLFVSCGDQGCNCWCHQLECSYCHTKHLMQLDYDTCRCDDCGLDFYLPEVDQVGPRPLVTDNLKPCTQPPN